MSTLWNLECTTEDYGLRDINTENKGYQAYVIDYLNTLVDAGCDGFRFDAVKHIATEYESEGNTNSDFWNILGTDGVTVNNVNHKLDNTGLFVYGECLGGPYEQYTHYMGLAADGYGGKIRKSILKDGVFNGTNSVFDSNLNFGIDKSKIDKGIVTWVESHDTYCNDHESAVMTDNQIKLGWVAIAARSVGTPLFYSRPDGSDGANGNYWGNNVIGAKGNDEFKAPEVVAVNKFRNKMVGNTENLTALNYGKILKIDRYPTSNTSFQVQ